MLGTPKGLSDEKAARMMAALREGRTLRLFGVIAPRLQAYFKTHPEYAQEALPLIATNNEAARLRKGDRLRTTTHCRAGLHLMIGDNVVPDGSHGRKRCLACRRANSARAPLMSVEVADKVKLALHRGASLGQIAHGRPTGGGERNRSLYITSFKIIRRYRQENPEFDRFVTAAIADSNAVGQRIRYQRKQNAATREATNDYHSIRSMLPANFPDKDDVVSDIFEALLDGSLRREDVRARMGQFIAAHNRDARKYCVGKYGLRSIDAPVFSDSRTSFLDTISRGLWD
jgi:hypothetical protein